MKTDNKVKRFTVEFQSSSGLKYYYFTESGFILKKDLLENNKVRLEKFLQHENILHKVSTRPFELIDKGEIESYLLKNGFHELLIEVTTGCNLRCKYCVFSGKYKGQRTHGSKMLSIENAKKAIDLYFSYIKKGKMYNSNRKPTVGGVTVCAAICALDGPIPAADASAITASGVGAGGAGALAGGLAEGL